MSSVDTIAAISSAVGTGSRMIVRASGPHVREILASLTPVHGNLDSNRAIRCELRFSGMVVPACNYLFIAPRSVTGEDVVELHIPGNPMLARMLLDELIRLGARQAEPGEFTARAYFNGRIGLSQAEGVAATIAAQSERELVAARQLLAGELSRRLKPIMDELANTLAMIEVGIDFSEEDVTFLSKAQVSQRVDAAEGSLQSLLNESARFDTLSHEPQIVLVGRPNAGKSTLLNALAESNRAVVSPQAGTTRDIIWAHVRLKRGITRILDIAGLEEDKPNDSISRSMQSQALRAIEQADVIVLVRDCTDPKDPIRIPNPIDLRVETKADLLDKQGGDHAPNTLLVSALSNQNMQSLRDRLDELAFGAATPGAKLALNTRHVRAIEDARDSLIRAKQHLAGAGAEIIALDLRESLDSLGQVLGIVTPDDLLGRIFSTFCIGK